MWNKCHYNKFDFSNTKKNIIKKKKKKKVDSVLHYEIATLTAFCHIFTPNSLLLWVYWVDFMYSSLHEDNISTKQSLNGPIH